MKPYYEHAGITIYHGDCREVIIDARLDWSSNILITDPPYGLTDEPWDVVVPPNEWMKFRACVMTASEPFATEVINASPLRFRYDLVWIKNTVSNAFNASLMPMRAHERILVFGEPHYTPIQRARTVNELARLNYEQRTKYPTIHQTSVLEFDGVNCRNSEREPHHSQKPIELFKYLIAAFALDAVVLDPFMGTGTTLVAAKNLGKESIGIEIEERYCEIAAKRLSQEVLPLEFRI